MFISSPGSGTPPQESDFCLICCGSLFFHRSEDSRVSFLRFNELGFLKPYCDTVLEIGAFSGQSCFAMNVSDAVLPLLPGLLPATIQATEIRTLLSFLDAPQFQAISTARHLLWWNSHYRYCSRCGQAMHPHPRERAHVCPACQFTQYPVIAPAIIVAVRKGDSLLLAHNRNTPGNRHGLVAGFVESGESLEQTVARELREEVGICVEQIAYHSSQPWSFPNSLMLGFTARWKSGDIQVDGVEIDEAGWFSAQQGFPEMPPPGSIAGRLIQVMLADISAGRG